MKDFILGGFKMNFKKEVDTSVEPVKKRPAFQNLNLISKKSKATKTAPVTKEKITGKAKSVNMSKKSPNKTTVTTSEKKTSPFSFSFKSMSTLEPVAKETKKAKDLTSLSSIVKSKRAPGYKPVRRIAPKPKEEFAPGERAIVVPQSTYEARIASFIVFSFFLYFFVTF